MPVNTAQLDRFGLLQVKGPDAAKFLQGQVTCDINQASQKKILFGAHCNHKGRMIANFSLIKTDEDTYTLKLSRDLLATLKTSFDKYIVFSKAETKDLSDDYRIFGLQGDQANTWFKEQGITPSREVITQAEQTVLIPQSEQRFEYWLPTDNPLTAELQTLTTEQASNLWQLADIKAGLGWINTVTSEQFLPQLLNLDAPTINGISFTKGCYTGQEIVARIHYKGKTKRRLQHLQCEQPITASPGDELYNNSGNQSIGNIVNLCLLPEQTQMLAVVMLENANSEDIYLDREARVKLSTSELPYAINTDQ